jgi:hypothetical protein
VAIAVEDLANQKTFKKQLRKALSTPQWDWDKRLPMFLLA